MIVAVLYFAAAGALMSGAGAASKMCWDRAVREAARSTARMQSETERQLLEDEISLEQLRREAREVGVDPDDVVRRFEQLRQGFITFDELKKLLGGS